MSEMVVLDKLASFVKIASDHRRRIGRNMKSYVVKVSDCEEGPYAEAQVAQMFVDGRIDRNTPCKPSDVEIRDATAAGYQSPCRSSTAAAGLVVITTRVSDRFRHSVRVCSEDHVQMDGGDRKSVV